MHVKCNTYEELHAITNKSQEHIPFSSVYFLLKISTETNSQERTVTELMAKSFIATVQLYNVYYCLYL